MSKALVIASHPDDQLLGFGCTWHKLERLGWTVEELILGKGRGYPDDNAMDACPLIETVKRVEEAIVKYKPDRIYTHSRSDLNVDHDICHRAVLTATRPVPGQCVKEIYCFETASSTEWNFTGQVFRPNVFEEITDEDFRWKIAELYRLYPQEMREFPHPRSTAALRAAAQRWGSIAGVPLAEAFELVRCLR